MVGPVGLEPTTYGLEGRCSGPLFWSDVLVSLFWFVRTLADCGRFRLS